MHFPFTAVLLSKLTEAETWAQRSEVTGGRGRVNPGAAPWSPAVTYWATVPPSSDSKWNNSSGRSGAGGDVITLCRPGYRGAKGGPRGPLPSSSPIPSAFTRSLCKARAVGTVTSLAEQLFQPSVPVLEEKSLILSSDCRSSFFPFSYLYHLHSEIRSKISARK